MSRLPRRALLALTGGALLFAGHPPLGWGSAGLIALVPLLALARDVGRDPRPVRTGLGWGLLAGAAFFGPLLYWIAIVDPIALPLLAFLQSLSVAAFVGGLAAWGGRPWRPLAAVVWWVALEAVRSAAPWGGFPWGVLGYTQHDAGLFLPVARTLGVLGVSAACAAVAVCVEEALFRLRGLAGSPPAGRDLGEAGFAVARGPLIGILAVLAAAVVLGADPPASTGSTIDLAAIQGNDITGTRSLNRSRVLEIGERMLRLTRELATSSDGLPDVVVWPENALDADVTAGENPELERLVDQALESLDGVPLLAGMRRTEDGRTFNTQVQFGSDGTLVDVYAKRSLVPFGEFVPLREYLGWFPPLERASDFSAGQKPGVFDVGGVRLATVICFENNFPELTRSQVRAGAEVLVVSTNNASFGFSPASSQHIAFSQLRAVESGRWVVHAGLNGISAVIDPRGRVTHRTALFEQAILRADVPLVSENTPFTRVGDLIGPTAMLASLLGGLWVAFDARFRKRGESR